MLFRKEAIDQQSERLTGTIILAQPMSIKVTVLLLVAIGFAIILFLLTTEYSRKETVRGFLIPSNGIIQSFANQGGTIERLFVGEGDIVAKGQPLATVTVQKNNSQGVALSAKLLQQLSVQMQLLEDEINQTRAMQKQESLNLLAQKKALASEQKELNSQIELLEEKLALLSSQQNNLEHLNRSGFLSNVERDQKLQALLDAKQEKQNLKRLQMQQANQLSQLKFEIINVPQQYALSINNLKRQQADIQNQLTQIEGNYQYTVTASNSGVITGIQVVEGETLSHSKPLMHIIPEGSELVAELLLPTRSAGFVQLGNLTRLRFDAFPYQRFGFINSEISRIDKALINPDEIRLPVELHEPVYRLRAVLNKQHMVAYGKSFELKNGMLLEADIMLEKRTLVEWLFEPLYSLSGRVG